MRSSYVNKHGFTIVELLIVIVVIGILAVISVVAYNGIQNSARTAKMNADLTQLEKAITVARNSTGKTLAQITGGTYTAYSCTILAAGTDLASLADTHGCKVAYKQALTHISDASGINVASLLDPWGRPYFIDENEGEGGNCGRDTLRVYANPFNGSSRINSRLVSLSGNSGCAV